MNKVYEVKVTCHIPVTAIVNVEAESIHEARSILQDEPYLLTADLKWIDITNDGFVENVKVITKEEE